MPFHPVSIPSTSKWIAGFLCLSAIALSACSTDFDPNEARSHQTIDIRKGATTLLRQAFTPNPATVATKTEVTWTNSDTTSHQIASVSGLFQGPVIKPGQTWSFLFSQPNTYGYYCLSPGHTETGTINVIP